MVDSEPRSQTTLRAVLWLSAFFVLAVFLRSYFAAQVGYDPTADRHMFTGNDPYFHWFTTTWVMEHGENLDSSNVINYPEGRDNPNPPLWTWTSAFVASLFEMAGIGGPDFAGSALNVMVAIWGALCILPIYMVTKDLWGRRAGLWAAFFMAVSAPHIQRSVWGYADHDAISMFFILLAFAFVVRAFKRAELREFVAHWNRGGAVVEGLKEAVRRNRDPLVYAALAGLSITACALAWKGYPYVFGILALAAFLQLVLDHVRNRDSTVTWLIYAVTIGIGVLLPWLLYYQHQPSQMRSTVEPSLYVLYGVIFLGLILVPTRDLPSVLVFPAAAGIVVLGAVYLYFLQPHIWHAATTGLGYFQQSKLYATIGEAQRPALGTVAAGLGFFTFLLAFWGFFRALRVGFRGDGPNILVVAWSIVAMYMLFRAARFEVNAAPLFAVLLGYGMDRIVSWMGTEEVRKRFRSQHGQGIVARSFRSLAWKPVVVGIGIVFLLVLPPAWLGVDAGMPYEYETENLPGLVDYSSENRDPESGAFINVPRLRAFGISFDDVAGNEKWAEAMASLSRLDTCWSDSTKVCTPADGDDFRPQDKRPAFVAWWDYGHWAVALGDHPTVADPFQSHYELSGRVLASDSEAEAMEWLTILLLHGDRARHQGQFSPGVQDLLARTDPDLLNMSTAPWYPQYHAILRGNVTDIFRFYDDVCATTGTCVGYLGVNARMYPAGDQGIFYAPVFLADKDPDEYIQTKFHGVNIPGLGARTIKQENYEVVDGVSRQFERARFFDDQGVEYVLYQGYFYPVGKSPLQGFDPKSGGLIQPQSVRTEPSPKFLSTFYSTAFGGPVRTGTYDASGHDQGQPSGDRLKHWRTFTETGTSRTQDGREIRYRGVALLAYYKGVAVNGTVVDEQGEPITFMEVRVVDGVGAQHDSVRTDAQGRFSILLPFSVDNDVRLEVMGGGQAIYNMSLPRHYTLDEARRGIRGDDIHVQLQRGSIRGLVFEDVNGNGTYEDSVDIALLGAQVRVGGSNATVTGGDGRFLIPGLQPNVYSLDARKWPEFANSTQQSVLVPSGGAPEVRIGLRPAPVKLHATFEAANGTAVPNVPMRFAGPGAPQTVNTNETGVATVDLAPGEWTITVQYNQTVTDANGTVLRTIPYSAEQKVTLARGQLHAYVTVRDEPEA
jgi:dolichyl-phosphooligosaccharide-protein glycotransferase